MPDAGLPPVPASAEHDAASAAAACERGLAARRDGNREAAVAWFRRALAIEPTLRRARMDLATTLREQGRWAEAEPIFRALLAEEPGSWPALVGLGICARQRRDLADSAEHLAAALALAPRERSVKHEYATTLREQRRMDEAEALYRGLLAEDQKFWPALVGLGICARQRRDLPASAEHLAAALALAPHDRSLRHEYATTLREQRRPDDAEPLYRGLLAEDQKFWPALVGLGLCARMRRDLAASAEHLATALALMPREQSVRLEYATTLREQRRLDAAEAEYRALLADDPASWPALLGLGLCARMRRDLPAAEQHLAAALALAPQERTLRLEHAHTLREQRRVDAAEAAYQALLADAPGFWPAMLGLGLCARMRNDRAAALAHLLAATEAAPEAEAPWFELAGEHRDAGRFAAARAVLHALAERDPAGGQAWLGLGLVERAAGDRTAAQDAFREGFSRDPQRHQLMLEIANEARALGSFAEAERWLRRAAEIDTVAPQALIQLGDLARARQQMEPALDLFRQAAALPGAPVGVHPALAQTLADLGRTDAAFAALDAAERQLGVWPEIALKRVTLLRRAGLREQALAAVRAAAAAMPTDFPLWCEWFETERFSGDFAGMDRVLAAAPLGTVQQRAQWHNAAGQLAAQRWRFDEADAAFRAAVALNPLMTGAHEALARVSLLRFDIAAARGHLRIFQQQRAPQQVALGLSPHLSHTHIGNLFDEFAIDQDALAALAEAQRLPPAARVAPLLARLREAPGHTATAVALLVALRQAGQFDGPWPEADGPAIPATIAQFWDEATPPDDIAALMQTWRECNPSHRYRRFDRESALAWLAGHCAPEVALAFRRAREPAMQADLFRLGFLFAEGGCYADADDRCLRPVAELLPGAVRFVAFQEEYGTLGNNFLAAAPLHPVLGLGLELAVQAVNRGDEDMMWLATGPGLITRAFAATLGASQLLPGAWLERTRILDRHELERVVATHCAVGYKQSRRHWLRATFGQPKAVARG